MSDSHIEYNAKGDAVSFVGPDAVNMFRAATLASALKLYAATKMLPTRGVTASGMLKLASEYTGKKYKRGEYQKAADDVGQWVQTMKAALPHKTQE